MLDAKSSKTIDVPEEPNIELNLVSSKSDKEIKDSVSVPNISKGSIFAIPKSASKVDRQTIQQAIYTTIVSDPSTLKPNNRSNRTLGGSTKSIFDALKTKINQEAGVNNSERRSVTEFSEKSHVSSIDSHEEEDKVSVEQKGLNKLTISLDIPHFSKDVMMSSRKTMEISSSGREITKLIPGNSSNRNTISKNTINFINETNFYGHCSRVCMIPPETRKQLDLDILIKATSF